MAYAAYTDVEARITHDSFTTTQVTRCGTLLDQASTYIDGTLGSKWAVPFAAPYPGRVVECCILIASGWFIIGEFIDQPQTEAMERRAEAFLARGEQILADLAANPSLLAGLAELRVDADTVIAPAIRVTSYPPSVTLQDSSTWRRPTPSASMASQDPPQEWPS